MPPLPSSPIRNQNLSLSLSRLFLRFSSMARALSQTLIRVSSPPHSFLSCKSPPFAPSARFVNHRNRSNQPEKAQLIEVDLDTDNEIEFMGMRRLEDAIHGLIVRRSAPDWLPFIPGSSYWVPPRKRPYGIAELVGRLANPLTKEETLSLTTVRGWPSSAYFVEGASPFPAEMDADSKNASQSEDEEG